MENWTKELFEQHLNTPFTITAGEAGSIETELVEVVQKKDDMIINLSILFKGPKEPVLPHDNLNVKHDKMGKFDLFVGPIVHPKKDGVYYQACFSKILDD